MTLTKGKKSKVWSVQYNIIFCGASEAKCHIGITLFIVGPIVCLSIFHALLYLAHICSAEHWFNPDFLIYY